MSGRQGRDAAGDDARLRLRRAVAIALLAAYVLADVALRPIALVGTDIIPWYPSAGLALALLVLAGPRWALGLLAARVLLHLLPHPGATTAPLPLHVATLEAAMQVVVYAGAAELIRRRVVGGLASWRTGHALWLMIAIALPATLAAFVSSIQMAWMRGLTAAESARVAVAFATGDAAGALVVLPALLITLRPLLGAGSTGAWWWSAPLAPEPPRRAHPDESLRADSRRVRRSLKALAVVMAMLVASAMLANDYQTAYVRLVCLLPLAWISVREGIRGTAIVLAAYGAGCLALVATGLLPDGVAPDLTASLLSLGVVGLLLGAARTESDESAARYWHLLAASGEGIWRVDAAGRTLYLNDQMLQIIGRTADEVERMDVRDLVAPEERASWETERALRAAGEDTVYETSVLRPDGTRRRVLVRGSVVRSTTGEPIGSVALVTDVTAIRQSEAEGRRAQLLLETAFRSSRDAMILYRAEDERIIDVNEVWCQVTGYRREQVIGRSQRELRIWGDPADAARMAEAIREHGVVRDFEIAFNRHVEGGQPQRGHALLSAVPAEVGGVTYYLVTGRDITVERRREESERQLRRLEELGRLAGSVSHDFNNLLTVVAGYAQLARASVEEGQPVALEDLEEIERAARRGHELTKRLLAFSRHQVVEPRVVDLGDVVEHAHGMLRSVLGSAQLRIERARQPLPILADPSQVDQVLLNLAVNARDALPEGGTVTIVTGRVHAPAGEVAEIVGPDALPGDYAMLRVRDTGAGMDSATAARIFEPFFSTKASGAGTGLGLAVVMGIVRHARGGVRVESSPGRGSTFTVYWPVASLSPVPSPAGAESAVAASTPPRRARVLLVEDEATVQRVARRVLEDAGHEVHTAANGELALECLAELEAAGTPPDVVLSDVTMPRMGGRALAEQLAVQRPGLPVVLMSAHTGSLDVREGLANVPVPLLAKPFQVDALLAALTAALARPRMS